MTIDKSIIVVCLCLAAFLNSHCGFSENEKQAEPSTMTILTDEEFYSIRLGHVKYLLFLPLVDRYGPEIRPRLAESWEHSPDYRTWTFHLRNDVLWHDDVPVTAHDVAFNLELFAYPDVMFPAAGPADVVDSISVPDDYTITLTLMHPVGDMPAAWPVFFPKHLLQDLDASDFYKWDFWTHPVGNGPYRFVRHVPKTMFEFESNPDFYAGEPSIKRVVIKIGGASPVVELTSGGVDVAYALPPPDLLKLKADPRFVVYYRYDWSELQAIYWNHRHDLFAEAKVRRALSHAIDRRELARMLNFPDEMPLVGGVSNEDLADYPYRQKGWDQGPTYDPDKAVRLLNEVGWIDRDGNGIREKAGREARFTLLVPRGAYIPGVEQGLLVQHQLKRVGITAEIRSMEYSLTRDAYRAGDFEAMIGWVDNTPSGILERWLGEPAHERRPGVVSPDPIAPFGYYEGEAAQLLQAWMSSPILKLRMLTTLESTKYFVVTCQLLFFSQWLKITQPIVGSTESAQVGPFSWRTRRTCGSRNRKP